MDSWHSYPKVWNLGHPSVDEIFKDDVIVEEKVDGSQFSFGRFQYEDGETRLRIRSKGCEMILDAPQKMFPSHDLMLLWNPIISQRVMLRL